MGEFALFRGHILYRQSIARFGNKMPVSALVVFEIELGLRPLFVVEGGEKVASGLSHLIGGEVRTGRRAGQEKNENWEQKARDHGQRSRDFGLQGNRKMS